MSFQLGPRLKKPPLEFALRARAQALELDNSVEEVCAGGRKIADLARELG